jgi:hypothetical protein
MNQRAGLFAVVLVFLMTLAATARAAQDPRFFGTYYLPTFNEQFCKKYRVKLFGFTVRQGTSCKTVTITDIAVHLDYRQGPKGGFVSGFGHALYGGETYHFSVVGPIIAHGLVRLTVGIDFPEFRTVTANAYLSNDGVALNGSAFGYSSSLRKDKGPNKPPKVVISSPSPGASHAWGSTVPLSATITDEDPSFPLERQAWHSDRDGPLSGSPVHGPKSHSLLVNDLSPGPHKITFEATDSGGLSASASVSLNIGNTPPDVPTIFQPKHQEKVYANVPIALLGQAWDAEEGWLGGDNLSWSSDRDGVLASGAQAKATFKTPGSHVLRFQATDALGASRSSDQAITVLPYGGNSPPAVKITKPAYEKWKGLAVLANKPLQFIAQVADKESPLADLKLTWHAIRLPAPGELFATITKFGQNSPSASTALAAVEGAATTYRIRLTAEDPGGLTGEDWVVLLALPKTIE